MNIRSAPSILFLYPSCFYYPAWADREEIKSSQLLLASYVSQYYPVTYGDLEISIGRPASRIQVRRYERQTREYLEKRRFDILAISCWTSLSYQATMITARVARALYPNCLIIVGGYHPTARPDDFLTSDHVIDYVIRGEGELALTAVAESFSAGRPPQTQVIVGQPLNPEQFADINWELVDEFIGAQFPLGLGTLVVYLSRGCPFGCSFCMETLKNRRWRPLAADRAFEQIRRAGERYQVISIGIGDACFGVHPQWRKRLLSQLAELNPPYWVLFETRPEFLDREDIDLLSRFKSQVQFGLESCSVEMLRIMNKTRQPERFLTRFREITALLSEKGVLHGANLICNHPGETQRTLDETFAYIDDVLTIPNSSLIWACHAYTHFPGSEVDRNRQMYEEQYGSQFLCPDWWRVEGDQYDNGRMVYPSRDLSDDRSRLWARMIRDRDEAFKRNLTPQAFHLAADTFFPDWKSDPRYQAARPR
jgi:radical SAM superfamily enzyme YgiQ (UPF0313 family)